MAVVKANVMAFIQAGTVIYETARAAWAQYVASSDEGRRNGAIDLMFR